MDTTQVRGALQDLAEGVTGEERDAALAIVWDAVYDKIITDDTRADAGEPDENGDATELTLTDWLAKFDYTNFGGVTAHDTENEISEIAEMWDAETIEQEGYDAAMIALARFLECKISDITDEGDGRYREGSRGRGREYLVGTDKEMDRKYDEYLDSYIEDVVLSEIPEGYRYYFDKEKFKRDNDSDRAGALAGYDGNENEYTVDGEIYYIYRTN